MVRSLLLAQRRPFAVSCLLLIAHQACEALVPVVIGAALDRAVAPGDGDALIEWLAILVVLFVALSLGYRFGARFAARATLQAEHELRRRALVRLQAERIALPDVYKSSQGVASGSPT
jgi:putative ABC transport system ATP-binding protein